MSTVTAAIPDAVPIPPPTPHELVTLPHKPSVQIATRWMPAETSTSPLGAEDIVVVFLNGLMTTLPTWSQVIDSIPTAYRSENRLSLLCYDRYGQGYSTDHDPADLTAPDPSHGHDILSSVGDLGHLISYFVGDSCEDNKTRVILVANSIGCAIARLYTQTYPGTVAGLIFLDSIVRDARLDHVYPDPDAPDFDLSAQPAGVTVEDLRNARAFVRRVFDPSVGNSEGLSRRNITQYLPKDDRPKLIGWSGPEVAEGQGPFLTVVGHGFEKFAEDSAKTPGNSAVCTMAYINPYWWSYNEKLTGLSDGNRTQGPIEAIGAGHFIQRDRPDLVVEELMNMITKVRGLR